MIDAASTPPPDEAAKLVPWILSAVGAALTALWVALTASSRKQVSILEKQVASLEARLSQSETERARERVEARDALERLGRKLDEERGARARDAERTVRAVARRSSAQEAQRGAEQWDEMPTAVRRALDLVGQAIAPPADPFADLEEWTPSRSDPPRTRLPPRPR